MSSGRGNIVESLKEGPQIAFKMKTGTWYVAGFVIAFVYFYVYAVNYVRGDSSVPQPRQFGSARRKYSSNDGGHGQGRGHHRPIGPISGWEGEEEDRLLERMNLS